MRSNQLSYAPEVCKIIAGGAGPSLMSHALGRAVIRRGMATPQNMLDTGKTKQGWQVWLARSNRTVRPMVRKLASHMDLEPYSLAVSQGKR